MSVYRIKVEVLKNFMRDAFISAGVPRIDADICSDVLITADIRGIDSHGINRLKPIYLDRIRDGILNPITKYEIVKDTETTAVIDGHNGMGHVISRDAMLLSINKAKQFGMGMTAVRNSTHYGIAGYYSLMAIENNMIGITGTNARPSIAPTFGVENMLGTNPLTLGLPTDLDFPFLLDCATSISQRGKIELYAREGKDVPEGWVIDRAGKPMVNSDKILDDLKSGKAALSPLGGPGELMGGYKGFGYALFVEIMSAALQNGSYLKMLTGFDNNGQKIPYPLGHFFIAINIKNFIEPKLFRKISGNIIREIQNSKKAEGEKRIYVAGEKEHIASIERKRNGIPINHSLQNDIKTIIKEYALTGYDFPF